MTRATATKKATRTSTRVTKTIAKAATTKKNPKTATKTPVAPKKVESAKTKKANLNDNDQTLDLCLLMDCTSSMYSWIARSKDTLNEIIDTVKSQNSGLKVRVSFVGYRDIKDSQRFTIQEFTENIELVKNFISKTQATGGADMPEDV